MRLISKKCLIKIWGEFMLTVKPHTVTSNSSHTHVHQIWWRSVGWDLRWHGRRCSPSRPSGRVSARTRWPDYEGSFDWDQRTAGHYTHTHASVKEDQRNEEVCLWERGRVGLTSINDSLELVVSLDSLSADYWTEHDTVTSCCSRLKLLHTRTNTRTHKHTLHILQLHIKHDLWLTFANFSHSWCIFTILTTLLHLNTAAVFCYMLKEV